MLVNDMSRADLEAAVIEHEILPCNTPDECAALLAMDTEAMRTVVLTWLEAGSEV